jgi:glycosyltransferase involved in cell wall biosynthesis
MSNKILITQQELSRYGGSEVVTLELSNYFIDNGFKVVIATNYYGQPISEEFNKSVDVVDFGSKIDIDSFSHIWIHHNMIPWQILEYIEEGAKIKQKIAFHHMSPYLPIESPLSPRLEEAVADCIYFNSDETYEAYKKLFKNKNKLKVFGNPAPDKFYNNVTKNKDLRRVLVVSNHIPPELYDAIEILKTKGIDTDIFGIVGIPKLVTPDELSEYDVVISIGKTVQYSLVGGIPVYCYDHFGGSGYLTKSNFDKNRSLNFSGRGFRRKKADVIAKEIVQKYQIATRDATTLKAKYADEFRLTTKLASFIDDAPLVKNVNGLNDEVAQQRVFMKTNISSVQSIIHLRKELDITKSELNTLAQENIQIKELNNDLGKRLLRRSPIKLAKRLIKKATGV